MANDNSMISVKFNETTWSVESRPVWQYDHGLTLQVYGLDSVLIRQVHFANTDTGKAFNVLTVKNSDGSISAQIPDVLLCQDKDIQAFLYFEDEVAGYTFRTVRVPLIARAKPETISLESSQLGPVNEIAQELKDLIEKVENTIALNNVSFQVSSEDSCLYMYSDEELRDSSFEVNESDGCLYLKSSEE